MTLVKPPGIQKTKVVSISVRPTTPINTQQNFFRSSVGPESFQGKDSRFISEVLNKKATLVKINNRLLF